MGLRSRALRYTEKGREIDQIEKIIGSFSGDPELIKNLKNNIEDYLKSVKGKLDRKLLDMQTIFDIGKEINSTLHLQELIQIIIFTLMGQFRISDVAVYKISDSGAHLIDKKGFADLDMIPSEGSFNLFLSNLKGTIPIEDLSEYTLQYELLKGKKAGLIVPVKNREKLTGFIVLGLKEDGSSYSADESDFIFTIASLSGIAMENARLYGALEKKLSELSSLYEISKVINSSDDYQSVLTLITETITTGFGVSKAILLSFEENGPVVRKVIGLPESLLNKPLALKSEEENLFLSNCAGVLKIPARLAEAVLNEDSYLFMPLISSGTKIGAIFIFSFKNYSINTDNLELINLFSIIASQIAPPLALTKQIGINREISLKPFESVLEFLQKEIEKARNFGVSMHLIMVKLSNLSKYIKKFGDQATSEKLTALREKISFLMPNTGSLLQYGTTRLLLVLPEIFENDINDLKNSITQSVREIFTNSDHINIIADISAVNCSDEKNGLLTLLNLIE